MTDTARPATNRQVAKEQTRQRLLDAALGILDREGETALTTTKVTQLAGVKQPTFYVHFVDMDDLLRHLVQQLWAERRASSRQARDTMIQDTTQTAVRELFRTTVESLAAHPAVLRLVMRSRLDHPSPLGEYTRAELATTLDNLAATLAATGVPHRTAAQKRKLQLQAEGLNALVENLAVGHLDGRYDELDEVLDVLVQFSRALSLHD